jgi:hypothetical protein
MVIAAGMWNPAWAQKGGCKDVPIRWFVYPVATMQDGTTVPTNIAGDGDWYANGSGATNSVIHVCAANPTRDATATINSKRKLIVSFPAPITGSVIEETVTGTYQNSGFMNLRNILCAGCADPTQPFTTHMSFQFYSLRNRQDYRLRFMPPVVDAPDLHIDPNQIPYENMPYESSPVLVIPQPYDCLAGGVTKPSWIIRAANPSTDAALPPGERLQVGTLYRLSSPNVHAGQYSMPFEMRIEAQACFSY